MQRTWNPVWALLKLVWGGLCSDTTYLSLVRLWMDRLSARVYGRPDEAITLSCTVGRGEDSSGEA